MENDNNTNKRGRKKFLINGEPLDTMIFARVTHTMYEQLQEKAYNKGLTLSLYIRMLLAEDVNRDKE